MRDRTVPALGGRDSSLGRASTCTPVIPGTGHTGMHGPVPNVSLGQEQMVLSARLLHMTRMLGPSKCPAGRCSSGCHHLLRLWGFSRMSPRPPHEVVCSDAKAPHIAGSGQSLRGDRTAESAQGHSSDRRMVPRK